MEHLVYVWVDSVQVKEECYNCDLNVIISSTMPIEGVGMSTIIVCCNRQLYYCSKYPMYYVQRYR